MYDGTMRGHWQAIVTLQQMIVLADASGVVDMTAEAISSRTTIPIEIIQAGIEHLMKEDPYTRTPGDSGRRIVLLDDHRPWGWRLVNHAKYRGLRNMADKREADRLRIAEKRSKNKDVATTSRMSPMQYADADANTENQNTVGLKADGAHPWKNGHDLKQLRADAFTILQFLNEKAGKNYQPVKTNIDLIVARLREGGTADDMRAIIAKKCREWRGRDGMGEYLRPATLFGAKNFWQKYQGELAPK